MNNNDISILVVEDDPVIRDATVRIVTRAGYEVIEAVNAAECFRQVCEKRPDMVLLDVVLPDLDGYEICRKIKSDPALSGVYVLLVSGIRTDSEEQSEGLECGADGYVARPVPNRELVARIGAMARIIRAERVRDALIRELKEALANIKVLKGLLPICCHCKKIRDDQGYWSQVEVYIHNHSEADFSHGICPDCVKELYPEEES